MKRIFFFLLFITLSSTAFNAYAQKQDKNIELKATYVCNKLHLNKAKTVQFKPLCIAFLKEMRTAKSGYDGLKSKNKSLIKSETLSNATADQLIQAHWVSDAKELDVKKKYTPIFKKVLSAEQTYYAFDYAGDSMKKVSGKKSKTEDDDE